MNMKEKITYKFPTKNLEEQQSRPQCSIGWSNRAQPHLEYHRSMLTIFVHANSHHYLQYIVIIW